MKDLPPRKRGMSSGQGKLFNFCSLFVPYGISFFMLSAGNRRGPKKSGRSFRVSAAFPDYQSGLHKLLHRRRARKTGVLRLH